MKIFEIEVLEILSRVIKIEANEMGEAIDTVKKKYDRAEIVLNYNDFVEVDFIDIHSQSKEDIKRNLIKDIIEYLYEDEKKHYEEFDDDKPKDHIFLKLKELSKILN
jgi:hypothetical protein